MLEISSNAKERLNEILKDGSYLLVSVVPGGCNGFSYKYTIETNQNENITEVLNSPRVFISNSAKSMLEGSVLNFTSDEFGTAFFSIANPNASSKCGCGSSFSINY